MKILKKFFKNLLATIVSLGSVSTTFASDYDVPLTVMHKLEVISQDSGGTLIFSDSPEYVRQDGILYTDTVVGDARLFFYHLNDTNERKRFAIIFENTSDENTVIEITRGGLTPPNADYFSVGKIAQMMYMEDNFQDQIKLSPYERKEYLPFDNYFSLGAGQLVHGLYDFNTNVPVRIFLLMYPDNTDSLEFLNDAQILPKDDPNLRGTFKHMNRTLTLKKSYDGKRDGLGYIMIGDDVNDMFKHGIDATDDSEVINYGNYGMTYTLNFQLKDSTQIFLSPLGGVYAGAMRYKYFDSSGVILTPKNKLYFGDKTPPEDEEIARAREKGTSMLTAKMELANLGSYKKKVSFEYSPPGASNLPVHIILVPEN